jgi:hypothetical protein
MKTTLKRIAILLVLTSASYSGFSQFHAAFEFSSTNKGGLGYRFSERIWTELSFYESIETDYISPELVFYVNLDKADKYDIYIGFGGAINYYSGFTLPIGTQFRPFSNLKELALNIELHPVLDVGEGDIRILPSCGIRYSFNAKKQR